MMCVMPATTSLSVPLLCPTITSRVHMSPVGYPIALSLQDLKVFSICSRGFAMTYGGQLSLGHLAEPRRGHEVASPVSLRAPRSMRSKRGLLINEEHPSSQDFCSL